MSAIVPDEWLDYLLTREPKGDTVNAPVILTFYVGLFTSQTTTTVPNKSVTLGVTPSGVTEVPFANGYARQAILNTSWGIIATSGAARVVTVGPVSYPESTGPWALGAPINGFFLCTRPGNTFDNRGFFYKNFDDGADAVPSAGYTVTISNLGFGLNN
jgi:hypothetical protein